ncbi:terminase [Nakamurella antarctica]|uniref:Terminase n=1 Tax=Nakamurella antarctica TaxID=1902245 RepID=A0A3G8ZHU6_9ACTN|nr:terminase family protein [Nakamurella antarctica]AZI56952.1 terminase [Nakamurella antarctica]
MNAFAADAAAALDPVAFGRRVEFVAEPWQERLLRTIASRVVVNCARQVGKTTTTAIKSVHTALYRPNSLVLLFSPGQRQSNEMLRRCRAVYNACGRPVKAKADSESTLELENGSRIVSLPGTEGTSRGFAGARLLILDEASRVDDDIFASVLPMVASDGQIIALSTPWGRRGWFHKLDTDLGNGWERHKVTAYESAQYSANRIAQIKAALGAYVFASDYECQFGDTDSQMFNTELIRAAFTHNVTPLEY